jgi:Zn-dependent protease
VNELGDALVYYAVFLFSTTLHEAAHAWTAKRGGDLTAYHGGQASLDPMPHIRREPFGMVILPLVSALLTRWAFGYASAPYDPSWASLAVLLSAFFSLNLLHAAFNLLPLPPLDGSGAMPLLLSREATVKYQDFIWSNPAIGWLGLFVAWKLFDVVFDPLFFAAVNLLYPGVSYS